ncbi:MAG: hypothetical protein R2682_15550 [Pyrinomonadaceae bacterium]
MLERDDITWIGRKRKVRDAKPAKDAEWKVRGSVFANVAYIFGFPAFEPT